MPVALASAITRGSWAKALSSASPIAARSSTRTMPTDEPIREGLTQHGSPSWAIRSTAPSRTASSTASKPTCGTPARAMSCLKTTLSMHAALARTSEPT